MGLLRSETMRHGTIILPSNAARFYVNLIGYQSNLQIQDMNVHDLHRPYKNHIQRIEDIDRMIKFLLEELRRLPGVSITRNRLDSFLADDKFSLDSFEEQVKSVYDQYVGFRDNNKGLGDELTAALEEKYVMQAAWSTLSSTADADKPVSSSLADPLLSGESRQIVGGSSMEFGHICGVISRQDQERFARTLFRATRGNCFTHFEEIPELLNDLKSATTCLPIEKSVFVTYFQGGASSSLYDKVVKICVSFQMSFYEWPANKSDAQRRIAALDAMIMDKRATLTAFEKYAAEESSQLTAPRVVDGNSLVEDWRLFCIKEKAIYATLNMFTGGEHHLTSRADCWFPASEEFEIKRILATQPPVGSTGGGSISATLVPDEQVSRGLVNPPTHFRKSEFTGAFQELVDTYGVPRYQEANPALFAIVTFPFIFGIMYGDIGHGSLLLAGGIYMLRNGSSMSRSDSDLVKGFYGARYLITAMGFFAVYAGLMYNDFFSLGLPLFTSRYEDVSHAKNGFAEMVPKSWFNINNDPKMKAGHGPYPFGLDPAWVGASNELLFVNSMKMKLSVLFGVVQMLVGVGLKFANSVFFKNKTDFVFECIPQLMFMIAFFGYMDWMIMYKWVTPISIDPDLNGPPGIINSMITMALGTPDKSPLYLDQPHTQSWLMFLTMIAVPLMLIPKPIILYMQNRASNTTSGTPDNSYVALESGHEECAHTHGEEFEIGEVIIHQMIETIEYVLGTVSHTASYLRLWALSLAHQQLSLVFFQKALIPALVSEPIIINGVWIYISFTIFFAITAGVLLGMDVMECFLHTLRLHWVEFQSKFYKADGYAFAPYSHQEILSNAPQA